MMSQSRTTTVPTKAVSKKEAFHLLCWKVVFCLSFLSVFKHLSTSVSFMDRKISPAYSRKWLSIALQWELHFGWVHWFCARFYSLCCSLSYPCIENGKTVRMHCKYFGVSNIVTQTHCTCSRCVQWQKCSRAHSRLFHN